MGIFTDLGRTVKRLPNALLFQLHKFSPGKIVVLAAGWAIVLGTLLLMLPWSTTSPYNLSLIDAVFTATSAVCVTGLNVADTAGDFTPLGQTIILILIQIGGLGYATLVTMLLLIIGRQIGLRARMMMAEALSTLSLEGLVRYAKAIVMWTFVVELTGMLILTARFAQEYPLGEAPFMPFRPGLPDSIR